MMTDQKRPYRMGARAEQQEATRRRITESAVELHERLGPSRTTMSAVAARAGVRRSTLYRHFADEGQLLAACTAHWVGNHPLPEIEEWARVRDPDERLRRALAELYTYYEGAEPMLSNIFRDLETMVTVRRQFAQFEAFFDTVHATLMAGRRLRGRRLHTTRAAVGHAIAFPTWRSLVCEQRCTTAEAVDLMCKLAAQ
jgi:AcrR family transcriptional regulator